MPNMNYCRFENTYNDLKDCADALQYEIDDIADLSESERERAIELIKLCRKITELSVADEI